MSVEINPSVQHVLAMDDNKSNLYVVQELLSDMEVEVHCVENKDDFFARLEEFPIDLIIMDIHMPDVDGFEMVKQFKEAYPNSYIPIIFLTAQYGDSDSVLKGLDLGAIDYLTKPIDNRVFVKKVERFLKESELKKDHLNKSEVYKKMFKQLRFH